MDDEVILGFIGGGLCFLHEFYGVFNDGDVVWREVEILSGELVYHRIDFHDSSFNAVFDECRGCCANSETTVFCQ